MTTQVIFTRATSTADVIEQLIRSATRFIDVALYRFNNPELAHALEDAAGRGVRVRLVLDRNKYEESSTAQRVLGSCRIPFRLLYGRRGLGSKMHHKFAILDDHTAISGSYNWTLESEAENYDSLLLLRAPAQIEAYRQEFEALWAEATQVNGTHPGA